MQPIYDLMIYILIVNVITAIGAVGAFGLLFNKYILKKY